MDLCIKNAMSLLRDSRNLLSLRSARGSFLLSSFALEEIGKIGQVFDLFLCEQESFPRRDRKVLHRSLRDHSQKAWESLYIARKVVLHGSLGLGKSRANARKLRRDQETVYRFLARVGVNGIYNMRLQSLYVDTARKDAAPPLSVPPNVSAALIQIAEATIEDRKKFKNTFRQFDLTRKPYGPILIDMLKTFLRHARSGHSQRTFDTMP